MESQLCSETPPHGTCCLRPPTPHTPTPRTLAFFLQDRGEKWSGATETQLCYEIKTFLLAGHETSAAMLCWSLYELSLHTGRLGKLRAEAAPIFGGDKVGGGWGGVAGG